MNKSNLANSPSSTILKILYENQIIHSELYSLSKILGAVTETLLQSPQKNKVGKAILNFTALIRKFNRIESGFQSRVIQWYPWQKKCRVLFQYQSTLKILNVSIFDLLEDTKTLITLSHYLQHRCTNKIKEINIFCTHHDENNEENISFP